MNNAIETVTQRIRELCLRWPEVNESGSWGHPNFRAGKRTFAACEWVAGRPSIAFKLGIAQVEQLMLQGRGFFLPPYGAGRWVALWADVPIDWGLVEDLLLQSYRGVALKRMLVALESSPAPYVR